MHSLSARRTEGAPAGQANPPKAPNATGSPQGSRTPPRKAPAANGAPRGDNSTVCRRRRLEYARVSAHGAANLDVLTGATENSITRVDNRLYDRHCLCDRLL